MIKVLELSNSKTVYINGKEITTEDAHEIIILLTKRWGNDFEKSELKNRLMDLVMELAG